MSRLTRAESQAHTRTTLLATAKTAFLRDGYAATSLEKVADEAGYSKGAIYSNFRNKDELCLAVLDAIHADQVAQMLAAVSKGRTIDARLDALASWARARIGDPDWSALEVEFAGNARNDPDLREALAQRDQQIRQLLAAAISSFATEFDLALPLPVDQVATAVLSLGIGLGLQRALDPSIDVNIFIDSVRAFVGLP